MEKVDGKFLSHVIVDPCLSQDNFNKLMLVITLRLQGGAARRSWERTASRLGHLTK